MTYKRELSSRFPPLPRLMNCPQLSAQIWDSGCYFMHFTPLSSARLLTTNFSGTMRVEKSGENFAISGDIYIADDLTNPRTPLSTIVAPYANNGIPIFPINDYRFYFSVSSLIETTASGIGLALDTTLYSYNRKKYSWQQEESLTINLRLLEAIGAFNFWTGKVYTKSGSVEGQISMVRGSNLLRRGILEIDYVKGTTPPLDNGHGINWSSIFAGVGWEIAVKTNSPLEDQAENGMWWTSHLHEKLKPYRKSLELDTEWYYHLMIISKINHPLFGLMYDYKDESLKTEDKNQIPREGAVVVFNSKFENHLDYGRCRGEKLSSTVSPYFHTALHEIGHAMQLEHPTNCKENHIMQELWKLAEKADGQFPENITWSFSPEDQKKLRHLPDIAVRPGGIPFATNPTHDEFKSANTSKLISRKNEQVSLDVFALNKIIPIGAPVRINFSITNRTSETLKIPNSFSMKTGYISGKVISHANKEQRFSSIFRGAEGIYHEDLRPGKSIQHSITVLRGEEGPLFPASGYYTLILELSWQSNNKWLSYSGKTDIMITPPVDDSHAHAALNIFSTPETLLTLATGAKNLKNGNNAIDMALKHPVLRPHYCIIEIKKAGESDDYTPDLKKIATLLSEKIVLTQTELVRIAKMISKSAPSSNELVKIIKKALLKKTKDAVASQETIKKIHTIIKQIK